MIHKRSCREGFTLIEVLIVVVIIAALAAMVIPRFVGQVDRTKTAEGFQMIGAVRQGAERLYATTGSYSYEYIMSSPGSQEEGDWRLLGLKDFYQQKFFNVDYEGYGSDGYYVSVWNTIGGAWTRMAVTVSLSEGTTSWDCTGYFKKKAGVDGDANPCTI